MKISINKYRDWIRLTSKVFILIAVLWILFGLCFGLHRVEGVAMSSRIEDGDLIFFSRLMEVYAVDDAIVYEQDEKIYLSSILGLPGDVIEIDENGCLYVNGVQASEDVVYNLDQGETPGISLPYRVPSNSYFVLNNNLEAIEDSRSFGAISAKKIKGKVISILRTRTV